MFKDDPLWSKVDELERLQAFEDFIRKLDKDHYVQQKANRQRVERKRRDAFREFVRNLIKAREVTWQTRWADFVRKYKNEPCYYDLVG